MFLIVKIFVLIAIFPSACLQKHNVGVAYVNNKQNTREIFWNNKLCLYCSCC